MQSLLYRQELLDHAQNPRNYGAVEHPDFSADDLNAFCGDRIAMAGRLAKDGTIAEIRFTGEGCAVSQAAASILTERLIGRPWRTVARLTPNDMLRLLNVPLSPIRIKCGLLALTVVQKAYAGYSKAKEGSSTASLRARPNFASKM